MAPAPAPCSWEAIPCGCALDLEDEATAYAVDTAAYVLWALSGRQFGCCELEFRPCRRDCRQGLDAPWGARLVDGEWVNLSCRSCAQACSCSERCDVALPYTPVCDVVEVVADGEAVGEGGWSVEAGRWLVLAPDVPCFPDCQDLSLPLGDPGTWGVTYTWGTPPPVAGRRAVGSLACEILKACGGGSSCLPKRTQTIVKQGYTAVMLDPMDFFDRHRTGIYEVDLFLIAANPDGRSRAARIASPDWDSGARRAAWPPAPAES